MPLGLHQQCKQRIVEKTAEGLASLKVEHRTFLERQSTFPLILIEDILPQTGRLKESIEGYISETPLYDFLFGTLSRELYENQEFDSETPLINLTDIPGYQNALSVAERLISDFESLPWEYSLSIKFDNDFGDMFARSVGEFVLGDYAKLIAPKDQFVEQFPILSGIEKRDRNLFGGSTLLTVLKGIEPEEWDRSSTYLQIKVNGFIGQYVNTAPLEEGVSLLKAFCGIAIALRLLKVNRSYRAISPKAKFFIHRKVDSRWVIERVYELEESISRTYSDLVFHDIDGKLDTQQKKVSWMQDALNSIRCVFSNRERSRRIILGSQWLFDSFCGMNELLSFVQAAVVLEILLGEKEISDLLGLGELLRNRCAYLIGRTNKERENILKDFKAIYEVRSKIVHTGKSHLNLDERMLFSKLQWMCRRVIQGEIKLLEKEQNNI
jgi:hypothetical protein